jgi:hypothetical protein
MISQTSYVAAFLFLGFVVFITIRGELPQYKNAILGGVTPAGGASGSY